MNDKARSDPSQLLRSNTKLKHLQLVAAISEHLHLGKVAGLMHLSQPTVSKNLAEVESLIGARLFERTPAGLVPTAQGKVFAEFAREMLSRVGRMEDEIASIGRGLSGTVNVGAQIAGTAVLVPLSVKLPKERAPRITVRLDDALVEPLMRNLRLGASDLVICRVDAIPDTTGLAIETLYQDAIVPVTGFDAPIARKRRLEWTDLAPYPWILPPAESSARRRQDGAMRKLGLPPPEDLVETGAFLSMLTLLRERQCVCLLPERLARYCESASLLRILPLPVISLGSSIGIARLRDRRPTPGVGMFIECLREAAKAG